MKKEGSSRIAKTKRALILGAGGWAREHWIDVVLPDFRNAVEIVGLVDINKNVLLESANKLNLPDAILFTDLDEAFERVSADFCVIVLPPHVHKRAVMKAVEKNIPILSEKPISDTYEDVIAIYKAVTKRSLKMAIIQNYRYESPIMTMKNILNTGKLGKIDYIISRYASDYREPGSWDVGSVYEMKYPLLVEGSIHHFDMIRNFAEADCKTINCVTWNPEWSHFKGNTNALVMMEMTNGIKAIYEGSSLAAGTINRWHSEYYRVECKKGSVIVDRGDRIVRVYSRDKYGKQTIQEIPPLTTQKSGHHKILADFLKWLDGGPELETSLEKNIQSALMVFSAIKASEEKKPQSVAYFLPSNRKKIEK